MCKVFSFLVGTTICVMMAMGCCRNLNVPKNLDAIISNVSSTGVVDLTKSTVKLEIRGKVVIEGKEHPVGMSASGVAITKKHILSVGHFCDPALRGIKKGILDDNVKMFYLNDNEEVVTMEHLKIVAVDTKKDLCLLEKERHGLVPIMVAEQRSIKRGNKVQIIAGPLGVFPIKTEGEVAIPNYQGGKEDSSINGRVIVTAPSAPGSSGGPCFDEHNRIIGVVMAGPPSFPHIVVLVPAKMIKVFLKEHLK
jgi:hypothetical protein